mmetsp:Transcript_62192/g.129001  ORF Transcript_62192/g.129001 Transcript_62192/m.129001 type:complete len:379 (+) Transcript_62192:500-1636(+)
MDLVGTGGLGHEALVADVAHEVVPGDDLVRALDLEEVTQIQVLDGKRHNRRVLLHLELGVHVEAADVHDDVGGEGHEAKALQHPPHVLLAHPVELVQARDQRHLGDDVAFGGVGVEGGGGEVEGEVEERLHLHLPRVLPLLRGEGFLVSCLADLGLPALDAYLALEHLADDSGTLGASEAPVQAIEEPVEELGGVGVDVGAVLAVALHADRLEQLVGRDLALEGGGVPHLAEELAEALDEDALAARVVGGQQEVVPHLRHARQRLDDDVEVCCVLEIVQSDCAWNELGAVDTTRVLDFQVKLRYHFLLVFGVQIMLNVREGRIKNLVIIGNTVDPARVELHENVMIVLQRMKVSWCSPCTTTEIFSTDQAHVNVEMGI